MSDQAIVPVSSESTNCVIVGAGPGGAMLGLLLARAGVPVTLLESHLDFDRDFRGDTVHPSTLELLDQLGLAERLHAMPHGKIQRMEIHTPHGTATLADLRRLHTKFPYVLTIPQARFLEMLTDEAAKYPNFKLILGANVQRLIQDESGTVTGVQYRDAQNHWHAITAALTVAADGRFSKIRHLAEIEPIKTAPPMDILWFRLPRLATDPEEGSGIYMQSGRFVAVLERAEDWQFGFAILKGSFSEMKSHGISVLTQSLREMIPWIGDRVEMLTDWKQASVLNVESSRVEKWFKPGLLLIGDAAHVMSPVGGVGINYAIQDAVETANLLAKPLKTGTLTVANLAALQKRREFPVKMIQKFQGLIQSRIAAPGLQAGASFRPPLMLRIISRIPGLRNLPGRMLAFGVRPVRISPAILQGL